MKRNGFRVRGVAILAVVAVSGGVANAQITDERQRELLHEVAATAQTAPAAASGGPTVALTLDDAVELRAGGAGRVQAPPARRIDLNQINADWHNAYASFIIDLSHRLQAAPTDAERLRLMAGLKDVLGVPPLPPNPTPITPVKASGTLIHGEPSGE